MYSISDLLELEIGEVKEVFKNESEIYRILDMLCKVRLSDYIIEMGPVGGEPGGYVLKEGWLEHEILLKDNKPVYMVLKYDATQIIKTPQATPFDNKNYMLREAMRIALKDAEGKTMHASKLTDEVYERKLY